MALFQQQRKSTDERPERSEGSILLLELYTRKKDRVCDQLLFGDIENPAEEPQRSDVTYCFELRSSRQRFCASFYLVGTIQGLMLIFGHRLLQYFLFSNNVILQTKFGWFNTGRNANVFRNTVQVHTSSSSYCA